MRRRRPAAVKGSRRLVVTSSTRTNCPIWLAYMRLEVPPGLSPITTVSRFDTVEAAQLATDELWAAPSMF